MGGIQDEINELIPDRFDTIVQRTLKEEGGLKSHPIKFGGKTKYGITEVGHPNLNIDKITPEQAKEIYRNEFYHGPGISGIADDALVSKVFDTGVLAGTPTTIRLLQKSLNKLGHKVKVDGILGDETIDAVNSYQDQQKILNEFKKNTIRYIKALGPNQYSKGWIKRISK